MDDLAELFGSIEEVGRFLDFLSEEEKETRRPRPLSRLAESLEWSEEELDVWEKNDNKNEDENESEREREKEKEKEVMRRKSRKESFDGRSLVGYLIRSVSSAAQSIETEMKSTYNCLLRVSRREKTKTKQDNEGRKTGRKEERNSRKTNKKKSQKDRRRKKRKTSLL